MKASRRKSCGVMGAITSTAALPPVGQSHVAQILQAAPMATKIAVRAGAEYSSSARRNHHQPKSTLTTTCQEAAGQSKPPHNSAYMIGMTLPSMAQPHMAPANTRDQILRTRNTDMGTRSHKAKKE